MSPGATPHAHATYHAADPICSHCHHRHASRLCRRCGRHACQECVIDVYCICCYRSLVWARLACAMGRAASWIRVRRLFVVSLLFLALTSYGALYVWVDLRARLTVDAMVHGVLSKVVRAAQSFRENESRSDCPTVTRLIEAGYLGRRVRDNWNQLLTVECTSDYRLVRSAGPDRLFETGDDVTMAIDRR